MSPGEQLPVAVDAMGGDHAPLEVVQGAVEFAAESGRPVTLVGREPDIREALRHLWTSGSDVRIVHADEVIEFGEKISSIRSKRSSSIHVGCRLVTGGEASAFVSAGHTGACMALAKVIFGLLEGVDRPALPAAIPRRGDGFTILLDVGANVDSRPEHFRQFAVMGFHYARRVFGVDNPRVALLSIGEEDSKGNSILREVAPILRETRVNFIGNIEGNQLFSDRADVVLCDGFVGNVALKISEGIAETIVAEIKDGIRGGGPLRRLGALPLRPVFRLLKKKVDYAEYGGVPLLGLRHVAVIAHGRSHAKAIRNALHVAVKAADGDINEKIARDIGVLHETEERLAASHDQAEPS